MSSHSAQRARKHQAPGHTSTTQTMATAAPHNQAPREMSPSPSYRDRQRTIRAQSLPMAPSVMQQMFGNASPIEQQFQQTETSPTRRSPPDGQVQRMLPTPPNPIPPPTLASKAVESEHHQRPLGPHHSHSSPTTQNLNTHYPRPVNRGVPPPQFLTQLDENWHKTGELIAELEQANQQSASMAYGSPSKIDTNPDHRSHRDIVESQRAFRKEHQRKRSSPLTPEQLNSPSYHSPLGSPTREGHFVNSPNIPRRSTLHGSPLNPTSNPRTPDLSLPVQEEPEEDHHVDHDKTPRRRNESSFEHRRGSPTPSSDLNPEGQLLISSGRESRAGHREDEEDDTLFEKDAKDDQVESPSSSSSSDDSFAQTPRSPLATLPGGNAGPTLIDPSLPQELQARAAAARGRARGGPLDQLGLQGIDAAVLDQTPTVDRPPPQYVEQRQPLPEDFRADSRPNPFLATPMHPEDYMSFMEDPTLAYLQAYYSSPRPDAPIPPTPHSQTAAPSPSPHVGSGQPYDIRSALPAFSPMPPAGSPYPFPYTHIRRNLASYTPSNQQQSSVRTPSALDPAAIHEQLVRQWQLFAQNSHVRSGYSSSEATLSPSATPHLDPSAIFNPWASLHTRRMMGMRFSDQRSNMSMQSSPSHEPIPLPTPPNPVGLRKKGRTTDLRTHGQQHVQNHTVPGHRRGASDGGVGHGHGHAIKRKPPPRVESTQPRDTSPELTLTEEDEDDSGDSTAGERDNAILLEPQFSISEEGNWVNGSVPYMSGPLGGGEANEDWIDEDEEEADEEDLLELEYHPSYISNVEKRRRRWETRWEGLVQAFQALDRQTDATLVLLAAPSHSTKLHSLTSRSIRRSAPLSRSTDLTSLKSSFKSLAAQRRKQRTTRRSSLADRFLVSSGSSPSSASEGDTSAREGDLRRALEAALGSLGALGGIYEQREARWMDEMRKVTEERERVELLLKQALGDAHSPRGEKKEVVNEDLI